MPTHDVVQVNVYRRTLKGAVEFLILKRVPMDGGFWQPITGHIEPGESHAQTLRRELEEETGLTDLKMISNQIFSYSYEWGGESGRDSVYGVEVGTDSIVTLNPDEHEAYLWLQLEEAVAYLKYDANKEAMRRVYQYATAS